MTALDWTALGLSQSREQVSIVLVLVLYSLCFLVTMFSARERRHRDRSLKLSVHCDPGPGLTKSLLSSVETTSDPGYESEDTERADQINFKAHDKQKEPKHTESKEVIKIVQK